MLSLVTSLLILSDLLVQTCTSTIRQDAVDVITYTLLFDTAVENRDVEALRTSYSRFTIASLFDAKPALYSPRHTTLVEDSVEHFICANRNLAQPHFFRTDTNCGGLEDLGDSAGTRRYRFATRPAWMEGWLYWVYNNTYAGHVAASDVCYYESLLTKRWTKLGRILNQTSPQPHWGCQLRIDKPVLGILPPTVGVCHQPFCPDIPWADYLRCMFRYKCIESLHPYETDVVSRRGKGMARKAFVEHVCATINNYDPRNPVDPRIANQIWLEDRAERLRITQQLVKQPPQEPARVDYTRRHFY